MTETEGEMKGGLLEGDLDTYQTTLEEVLTWLLMAEDDLQGQDDVSDDVEEVKEQFHTHEVRRRNSAVIFFLEFICQFWNSKKTKMDWTETSHSGASILQ